MRYLFVYNCEECKFSEILTELVQYKYLKRVAEQLKNFEIIEINLEKGEMKRGRYATEIGLVLESDIALLIKYERRFKIDKVPKFFFVKDKQITFSEGLFINDNNDYILSDYLTNKLKIEKLLQM